MRGPLTLHTALVPHLVRVLPRVTMALGAGPALAVCALPSALSTHPEPGNAALLLRVAAVLCVVPVAFALDDPAATTTAALPYPLAVRRLLRLALLCVPLAVIWTTCGFLLTAAMNPDDRVALPLAGLSLEAAGLAATTVLLSVVGLRLSDGGRGSTLAAPGSVLLPLVLALSPARERLFPVPYGTSWDASRWAWASALAVAAGLTALLLREHRPTSPCRDQLPC
ncbi:hypothetical protein EAO75_40530 [Streptomyces sp. uw30]|uniref:hypothetical protein n=1 Tax=Streptomyces sp. uw30 TaxID=1828179 RepID=UPI0011CEB1A5|nr:hypothetical protein [Streptomyces sp. uw30]TXS41105.1 hypothetical protein EAO75_40530 [Streptomyces sp. uw30]